jgi:hypothetical protein
VKYSVYVQNTVSAVVDVEANDPEAAIAAAFQSSDMPGSIGQGAFGSVSVDDGEWEPFEVYDEAGAVVWAEQSSD